jgi:hypothetical protein
MRTTVNLSDDVYQLARALARLEGLSLGDALAQLVRRGMRPAPEIRAGKGFPTFASRAGARPITLERTLAAEDER